MSFDEARSSSMKLLAGSDAESDSESPPPPPPFSFFNPPKRWVIVITALFGFFNVYAMRVNLSVAVVKMQKQYEWDHFTKGLVLGAFFYGYMVTQIPGGWVATRFGGNWVLGIGVLITNVLTLITPLVSGTTWLLLTVRVLEGIGEGVTFPAMHAIMSRWAPPLERTKLSTVVYSGSYLGTIVSFPLSGYLCKHNLFGTKEPWPAVFYVMGILGVIWFCVWAYVASNSPQEHPTISEEERLYITESIRLEKKQKTTRTRGASVESINSDVFSGSDATEDDSLVCKDPYDNNRPPWGSIFSSMSVWAIILAHLCNNWGFYMLLTCLPSYMKNVLNFDVQHAGFDSSLPYVVIFVVTLTVGRVADYLRDQRGAPTVLVRKVATSCSLLGGALFLLLAGYAPTSGVAGKHMAVLWLSCAVGSLGLGMAGWNINHLDVAPRYAGVLMGITNTAATIPGFAAPAFVNAIAIADPKTHATQLRSQWQLIFWIAAIVNGVGTLFFVLFASGKKQSWADSKGTGCCGTAPARGPGKSVDEYRFTAIPTGPSGKL